MKNIVVLVSGNGSNLQAIIDACNSERIPAQIVAVISNKKTCFALIRAIDAGIPIESIEHGDFSSREQFDRELIDIIDRYAPDLIVLAGFMRILTPEFVAHYAGRLLNIHPSLLPKYPGLNTYRRALDAGEREHGTTVHFVTDTLDEGPIVLQASVPILPGEEETNIIEKTVKWEHQIYPKVIAWFTSGRLYMLNNTVYLDNKKLPPEGIRLSFEDTQFFHVGSFD